MSREAMQLALELIEPIAHNSTDDPRGKAYEAITALRQALEQPAQQEPVAWKDKTYGNLHHQDFGNSIPLYTAPPKRERVGLTDQEIENLWNQHERRFDYYSFSCDIEAKLKEKNT